MKHKHTAPARGQGRPAARRQTPDGSAAARGHKRDAAAASRRTAKAIVAVSLAFAAALIVFLALLAARRPQMNIQKAYRLIAEGDLEQADILINTMEQDDYPAWRIADLRYAVADYLLGQGDHQAVFDMMEDLPRDDGRTAQLTRQANYLKASELYEADRFDAAAQLFYTLNDYEDSAWRYVDCRVAQAVQTYQAGDDAEARRQVYAIEDAWAHLQEAVSAAAKTPDEAQTLSAVEFFDPAIVRETAETMEELSAARTGGAVYRIATGYFHTVAVRSNGTVLATGDNSSGQCEVSGWTDIVQVAAGARHTVGLRLDGTVVAVGDDTYGQCDVADWRDVTAIAANAFGTLGLKSDGTVLASKYYQEKTAGWHGVTQIAAGAYSVGCLYEGGRMLSTHAMAQMENSAGLSGLAINGPVSAAIDGNGALVSSYEKAPDWQHLSCVAVGTTGFVGVTEDGQAVLFLFRKDQEERLFVEGRALEAASSGTHCAVITDEGRVFAFGSNGYGQCDVDDWEL